MTTWGWIALGVAAAIILLLIVRDRNGSRQLRRAREDAGAYEERCRSLGYDIDHWRTRAYEAEELYEELKAKDALNVEEETYLQESYGLPERPEL